MYCKYCGNEIADDCVFCGYCGASQIAEEETSVITDMQDTQPILNNQTEDNNTQETARQEIKDDSDDVTIEKTKLIEESSEDNKKESFETTQEVISQNKNQTKDDREFTIYLIIAIIAIGSLIGVVGYVNYSRFAPMPVEETYIGCDSTEEEKITTRVEYIYNEVYKNYKGDEVRIINGEGTDYTRTYL